MYVYVWGGHVQPPANLCTNLVVPALHCLCTRCGGVKVKSVKSEAASE